MGRGPSQPAVGKGTAVGQPASKPTVICSRCRETGHRREQCPQPATAASLNAVQIEYDHMCDLNVAFATDADRVTAYKDAEKRFGRCPICKNAHTYQRKVGQETVTWPSGRYSSCPNFMAMNAAEKGRVMEEKKGCIRCLSWNHQRPACPKRSRPCTEKVQGVRCPKSHDTLLHQSGSKDCEANHLVAEINLAEWHERRVLLAVEEIGVATLQGLQGARGFWDNGATLCLCTHAMLI